MGTQGVKTVRLSGRLAAYVCADLCCPNSGQRIRVVMNSKAVRSGGRNITLDWAEFINWHISTRDSGFSELIQAAENNSVSFNSVLF